MLLSILFIRRFTMPLNDIKVNVKYQKTIKTHLIWIAGYPMMLMGIWDINRFSELVVNSMNITVEDVINATN